MLYSKLSLDPQGNPINAEKSAYQPKKAERAAIQRDVEDFRIGWDNLNRPLTEYNHRSVIGEMNANQKSFNTYVPPRSDDPDESWRAQTVRPIVRNKLISIAAHVTAELLIPGVFAQNKNQDEDKDASQVMRDCVEWVIYNSNYPRSFLLGVISALVNPAVIFHQEFAEVMRKVKRMQEDGTWKIEEILDEVFSGFFTHNVPVNELLIANLYEPNIQRQRFLFRQKYVDYEEAKLVHGSKPNFKYVKKGVQVVFNDADNTFYETHDDNLNGVLVHEVVKYDRFLDLQLTYINGILLCDPEYPLQRHDKLYPFAKSGYEPINDGKFFYYKSAANKLGNDEDLVNTLYNMIMDGTFLSLMPPLALYGNEEINASVMVPGTVTSLRENTKLESIAPKSDIRAGLEAIALAEKSIIESSSADQRQGIASDKTMPATETIVLEQNAKIALGLFGKFIAFLVEDVGKLMIGDILQHLTVPEIDSITGIVDPLKYKTLLMPDQVIDGKKVTKKIRFSEDMLGSDEFTPEDRKSKSFQLLEEEGGLETKNRIFDVNPELFRTLKFKITVSAEKLTPMNKALEKAMNLELYDRAIRNPLADQEAVTRDFLFETYKPGESDKYIKKMDAMGGLFGSPFMEPGKKQPGVNTNIVGQVTGSNSLSNMMRGNGMMQG